MNEGNSIIPVSDEALRSPPSDGSVRLGPRAGSRPIRGKDLDRLGTLKRNAEYVRAAPVLGVHTVEMQESVAKEWAELKEKYGLPEDLALEDYPLPPSDLGLAHILWRVAKQLVSLLEKEYGFGQKGDGP